MKPIVTIIMGSKSDWPIMENASTTLDSLGIPHEHKILSAHRTPDALQDYLNTIEDRGIKVVIAAAGGAAHLPGVVAASTILPVIGVPMTSALNGLDSLLSIAQMPGGIPVATMAIGKAGAVNSALYAASILAAENTSYRDAIHRYRGEKAKAVLEA
jgi:5-(carboxyamino)imidazole ribonucleotide mutase